MNFLVCKLHFSNAIKNFLRIIITRKKTTGNSKETIRREIIKIDIDAYRNRF